MKQIYTPNFYVRLRHGGTLDLSVCREDKVEILRSVVRSLHLNYSANQLAQKLISEVERASKDGGVWGNINRLAQPSKCDLCGGERRWGVGKGKFKLCDTHNTWKTYFKMRFKK